MNEPTKAAGEDSNLIKAWNDLKSEAEKSTQEGTSNEPNVDGTTEAEPVTAPVEAELEAAEPTVEPKPEDSEDGLGLDEVAAKGLEKVPEQYRDVVRKAVEQTERAFKAQFTKKTQELAALKKTYEVVQPLADKVKLEELPRIVDQYNTLVDFLKRDDVKIVQGDEVIKGVGSPQEPDLESMSSAEQAKWYRAQLEKVKAEVTETARREVEPLKQSAQMAGLKQRFDEWRAGRKDVSDDVLNLARANALAFEQKVGKMFGPEFFDDLNASMEPFIAQARLEAGKAKKAARAPSAAASTEIPSTGLKPTPYKGTDLRKAWEEVRRESGIK